MGGVPTLLLVIAAGITYGWQPDREGGVEYIIQVPPDQLERLEQTGEITSVIDPEVQGHVSRVIIRVGNGPLPRSTPATLRDRTASTQGGFDSRLALSDAAPVPIPEMSDSDIAQPLAGPSPVEASRSQAVLKPDTNSTSGSTGYGFPGVPTTLQGMPPAVDQAGRDIVSPSGSQINSILGPATANPNAAATTSGTARVAPPATRTNPSMAAQTPPPFTGSDPQGTYARPRAGGPSTDPTGARDNTWQEFPSSTAASNPSMVGPENPFQVPAATSATSTNSATTATGGLAPGDTYGQLPSGISFSNGVDRNSATPSSSAYGVPNNGFYGSTATSTNSANAGQSTAGQQPGAYGAGTPLANTSTSSQGQSSVPDPRLTPVQVAAGAWSIDSYGRILDRQGRVMNATSLAATSGNTVNNVNPNPNTNYGTNSGYPINSNVPRTGQAVFGGGNSTTSTTNGAFGQTNFGQTTPGQTTPGQTNFGQTTPSQTNFGQTTLGQPTAQVRSGFESPSNDGTLDRNPPLTRMIPGEYGATRSTGETDGGFRDRDIRRTSTAATPDPSTGEVTAPRIGDPPSLSDRRNASEANVAENHREVVAPQPLFNGLLLISLVANVYLIFWLKNLRIQFRDLVAAKRMASSSTQ